MKEAIATQILLGFLLGHYVVFIDEVSLKSEGDTWGGSLVSIFGITYDRNKIETCGFTIQKVRCRFISSFEW